MIKDIALSISILDMFKTKNKGILNELWNHAIGSSIAAKLLSVNFSEEIDTESCFTSGLLHSIGKLVMGKDERYKEIFKTIDKEGLDKASEKEEEIFGFSSAELGSIMAQKWDFSSEMVYIILNIYDAQKIINVDQSFLSVPPQYVWNTAIVSLAARTTTFVGIGSEPVDCIPENLVQFLRFKSKEEFEEKFIPNFKETFFREKTIFV
jgi:HD-like signal output (HDOD) protein